MKVALVYDRVNKWGGAERVLLALHELFPDAPLYTSVYDKQNAQWAKNFEIKTSFLQNIPFASTHHELLPILMPVAFETFSFDAYDLVISVTSEAAKGIITKPQTKHICYCLTPTRYLWSGYDEYFKDEMFAFFSKPAVSYLRKWDLVAAQRPDAYIAISQEVKGRIKKYYGRESELVYPPVTIRHPEPFDVAHGKLREGSQQFKKDSWPMAQNDNNKSRYFLVVSRLSKFTKYKRVDLAIKAANRLKVPLKIIGEGNWREELEKMAGPTVEFVGSIDDNRLIEYYKHCKALLFPGLEDLGLVMVEAQSFGKPVIAFNDGGAKELVVKGKTGILFDDQTTESLAGAITQFAKQKFDPKECIKNAEKFNIENFKRNFLFVIDKVI